MSLLENFLGFSKAHLTSNSLMPMFQKDVWSKRRFYEDAYIHWTHFGSSAAASSSSLL